MIQITFLIREEHQLYRSFPQLPKRKKNWQEKIAFIACTYMEKKNVTEKELRVLKQYLASN